MRPGDSGLPFVPPRCAAGPAPAIHCGQGGDWVSYAKLAEDVAHSSRAFAAPVKALAFLLFANTYADVVAYLGALAAGHSVALFDPKLRDDLLARLAALYRPEWIIGRPSPLIEDYVAEPPVGPVGLWRRDTSETSPPVHPDLCLLLSTSGSTGSPKLVRLSYRNVAHNAAAIVEALAIGPSDRAIAHLPLHYSFGLSVLHSHLVAGASVVLLGDGPVSAGFWDLARTQRCTSFAGTPYHYDLLRRLDISRLDVPELVTMTQAGGRLAPEVVARFHAMMAARGGRFFVMYGQTEAAPRMTTLPPAMLTAKPGSVGLPLRDAVIRIVDADGRAVPAGTSGEVIYEGPNVMLGYAESRRDLGDGDLLHGVLHTGDLGYLDGDGCLFLVGRTKRIAKVVGMRISLDEVERMASATGRAAAVECAEGILLYVEDGDARSRDALRRDLAQRLAINSRLITIRGIDALPATSAGKIDYLRLRQELAGVGSSLEPGNRADSRGSNEPADGAR